MPFEVISETIFSADLQQFLAVSVESVQASFDYFHLNGLHVHFIKGLFNTTLPPQKDKDKKPRSIAVLRVDGNFYDSYQDAMYCLYEKDPCGCIVMFDDVMSHEPVLRFWNDF